MTPRLNAFGQFMALFRHLKQIAGTPQRLVTFYNETTELQESVAKLEDFLLRTDFRRRAFADKKLFRQVPSDFELDWKDYDQNWAYAIAHVAMRDAWPELFGNYTPDEHPNGRETLLEPPDPDGDTEFNPVYQHGGSAFEIGIDLIKIELEKREDSLKSKFATGDDERIGNMCRIALGSYDYLKNTIGLDIGHVFRRWQSLPPIFMPAIISNHYGDEKGSLNDLLNDAIRAYICGAPAAALALCRSCAETLLKRHYLPSDYKRQKANGDWVDRPLSDLIILAEKRYDCWKIANMRPRIKHANDVLHDYSRVKRLAPEDDRFVRDYLLTLKSLIQSASTIRPING